MERCRASWLGNEALVTKRKGKQITSCGHYKTNKQDLYLYPEEALYLLSINSLHLCDSNSDEKEIQALDIHASLVSFEHYRVYSYFKSLGYPLLRAKGNYDFDVYKPSTLFNPHNPGTPMKKLLIMS
jgi:hypothetical protein